MSPVDSSSGRGSVILPPRSPSKVREDRLSLLITRFEQCVSLATDQGADTPTIECFESGAQMRAAIPDSVDGQKLLGLEQDLTRDVYEPLKNPENVSGPDYAKLANISKSIIEKATSRGKAV